MPYNTNKTTDSLEFVQAMARYKKDILATLNSQTGTMPKDTAEEIADLVVHILSENVNAVERISMSASSEPVSLITILLATRLIASHFSGSILDMERGMLKEILGL